MTGQGFEPIYIFRIDGGSLDGRAMRVDDARGLNDATFIACEDHADVCAEIDGVQGQIVFCGLEDVQ